jgi:hypothetical protein
MANSPGPDTLGLTGSLSPHRARTLCRSSLGERLRKFQGMSLRLRRINFTNGSMCALLSIRCQQVTKLCFDKCELYITHTKLSSLELSTPLCPNVKAVSLTVKPNKDFCILSSFAFVNLFVVNAKIEHFGVSYGFQPRLLKKGTLENAWVESDLRGANWARNQTRRVILENLRSYSKTSVRTFTEYDQLSGPFMYDPRMFT